MTSTSDIIVPWAIASASALVIMPKSEARSLISALLRSCEHAARTSEAAIASTIVTKNFVRIVLLS